MNRLLGIVHMNPEVDPSTWDHTEVSINRTVKGRLGLFHFFRIHCGGTLVAVSLVNAMEISNLQNHIYLCTGINPSFTHNHTLTPHTTTHTNKQTNNRRTCMVLVVSVHQKSSTKRLALTWRRNSQKSICAGLSTAEACTNNSNHWSGRTVWELTTARSTTSLWIPRRRTRRRTPASRPSRGQMDHWIL